MTGVSSPSASDRRATPSAGRRTPAYTWNPARLSARAVARPMPVDAPVMTTAPLLRCPSVAIMPTTVGQRLLANKRWRTVRADTPREPRTAMPFTERSGPTRAAILAAARRRFSDDGFERTTVRAVAGDAGVDPSMVMRYFE